MYDFFGLFPGVVIVTYIVYYYVMASSRKLCNGFNWELLPPMYLQQYLSPRSHFIEIVCGTFLNWLSDWYVSHIISFFCLIHGPDIHICGISIIKTSYFTDDHRGKLRRGEISRAKCVIYMRDIYFARAEILRCPLLFSLIMCKSGVLFRLLRNCLSGN